MGEVSVEDYYSLCGRLDTLEHVHEVLVAVAAQMMGNADDDDADKDADEDAPEPVSPTSRPAPSTRPKHEPRNLLVAVVNVDGLGRRKGIAIVLSWLMARGIARSPSQNAYRGAVGQHADTIGPRHQRQGRSGRRDRATRRSMRSAIRSSSIGCTATIPSARSTCPVDGDATGPPRGAGPLSRPRGRGDGAGARRGAPPLASSTSASACSSGCAPTTRRVPALREGLRVVFGAAGLRAYLEASAQQALTARDQTARSRSQEDRDRDARSRAAAQAAGARARADRARARTRRARDRGR